MTTSRDAVNKSLRVTKSMKSSDKKNISSVSLRSLIGASTPKTTSQIHFQGVGCGPALPIFFGQVSYFSARRCRWRQPAGSPVRFSNASWLLGKFPWLFYAFPGVHIQPTTIAPHTSRAPAARAAFSAG